MEKQYESDEIEIDLKDLFFEIIGEWKKIAVSTVLAALIMFVISAFIITPQYQSTSKLYVLKSTADSISATLSDLQIGSNLANDYMEIIDGRPILDQVIANLDLDMSYGQLKGMLSFNNPSSTRILEITATHPDPQMSKIIVDEMADVASAFIAEKMKQEPPSVIQYGYVAKGAVSPNVSQNTVFGGLVGAFLAVAIIVISYLMNDTVMTPDDMERKVGLKVLASLPFDEEEDDGIGRPGSGSKKSSSKKSKTSSTASKSAKSSKSSHTSHSSAKTEKSAK